MTCENCGAINPPDAAYCAACGVNLADVPVAAGGGGDIPTRGVGALIDEAFKVYRANFLTFIALMALPQVANVLSSVFFGWDTAPTILIGFVLVVATIVLSIVATAAIAFGVARHYTRGRADFGESLSHAFQVAILLIAQAIVVTVVAIGLLLAGILLLVFGAIAAGDDGGAMAIAFIIFGILLVITGLAVVIWIGVHWFAAAYAVVLEGKGPIAGLGRSWNLVRGSWWRVLGITLLVGIIAIFAGFVIALPVGVIVGLALWAAGAEGAVWTLIGSLPGAVATVLVTPFAYIAGVLLYFDLRVRKEGFDLDALAAETSGRP